jgi:hypothetical protein
MTIQLGWMGSLNEKGAGATAGAAGRTGGDFFSTGARATALSTETRGTGAGAAAGAAACGAGTGCEIIGDFVHYLVPRLQTYSTDSYFCTYVHVCYWF